ncbi:nuclear transport factor 2 family protein, partial [Amycolatopsis sp. lyj-346]|uniref:nuclear transport factor 2 family protein n=1 Tax=Amycolatopsis sp. lyj-346 TaxID=2789289 RepID=UPI0039785894
PRFVADGPDRARGTSLLTAYLVQQKGSDETVPFVVGEDHDTVVRTPEGWRFASRRWVTLFSRS